jgi:hypothetical protein
MAGKDSVEGILLKEIPISFVISISGVIFSLFEAKALLRKIFYVPLSLLIPGYSLEKLEPPDRRWLDYSV